jgi:carboxyl-terminal processing protease
MKRKLLWLTLALAMAAQAATQEAGTALPRELTPLQQQTQAAHLAADVLSHYHYKAVPLDNAMSTKIFDRYLKALDPEKVFFVQADIDRLASLRGTLADAILKEDLTGPFAMFNLYAQRAYERLAYARSLLSDGFDFQQKEDYQYEREKEPWVTSTSEMHDLWRKRVKNDWLRLKLAGQHDKAIVQTLDRRYSNGLKRIGQLTSEDAFQTFMNAYTTAIEPHTNYFGPRAAEEFDISMKLSLVGVGAVLAEKDDFATIRELMPGGPAARSQQLNVGDRIVGVAQGDKGVMTDTVGWRLDDTVALIRGAPDSTVILDVLPANASPDGKHRLVSLIRKKITLEDQSAKKSVLTVAEGSRTRRIGVISLPVFYEDFDARKKGDQNFKSATRDVARLLAELKTEKVDGVLIDLRDNGGGSLDEAIELTGLFVGKGPVMQERDVKGNIIVGSSAKTNIAWNGPLGVLINRGSASASEIFAAAIQDYGRGLVIGERSFGKGTVQTVINLDQIAENNKPGLGELKFTIAQFFRINGGTTQLRGVTPDISFPTVTTEADFGESSLDNALPWMQIKAVDYLAASDLRALEPALLTRHDARVKESFQCLEDDIAEFEFQRKRNLISLNEAERRQERGTREARLASCGVKTSAGKGTGEDLLTQKLPNNAGLLDDGLQPNERSLAAERADEHARKSAKDTLLEEAVNILGDEASLLAPKAGFAARQTAPISPATDKKTSEAVCSGVC